MRRRHLRLATFYVRSAGALVAVWCWGSPCSWCAWCHGLYLAAVLRRDVRRSATRHPPSCCAKSVGVLGTERLPQLATSAGVDRPVMVGLVRPLVIVPEEMVQRVAAVELADVLVHECAHAAGRHQWIGVLQRVAGVVFWPHPLVCVLNRELARAREEVCDNYVLQRGDARRYAQTLLDVSQSLVGSSPRPVAFGLFHGRWKLDDRIAGLLDRRRKTMTGVNRWTAATLVAVFLLPMLAIAGTSVVEAAPVQLRLVNKMVNDFPEKADLSTPESAMAALCRAYARAGRRRISGGYLGQVGTSPPTRAAGCPSQPPRRRWTLRLSRCSCTATTWRQWSAK